MRRLALLLLAAALSYAQPDLQWGARTANLRIGIHADLDHDTLTVAVENNSADQLDFAFDKPGDGRYFQLNAGPVATRADSDVISQYRHFAFIWPVLP